MRSTSTAVARVYDRVARIYGLMEAPMEWMGGTERRRRVLSGARGRVLEVGIGTGMSLEHYSTDIDLVGIDISAKMLERARKRAERLGIRVALEEADVEALPFEDAVFDTVTATCVFCSVGDPIRGLEEVRRVVKPDGRVLLITAGESGDRQAVRSSYADHPSRDWAGDQSPDRGERAAGRAGNRQHQAGWDLA